MLKSTCLLGGQRERQVSRSVNMINKFRDVGHRKDSHFNGNGKPRGGVMKRGYMIRCMF